MRWKEICEERVCRTPGAFFNTEYSDHEVDVSVELPDEVTIPDMTDEQGEKFDDMIHDAMENIVATMIDDLDPKAEEHWAQARKNDLNEFLSEGENEAAFNPALLTLPEYYELVNKKDIHHESNVYQTDVKHLNSYGGDKSEYPTLLRQTRINGLDFEIRLKHDEWGYTIAVFNDENQRVASAQDEWGCMLYMVAKEYRGFGLGVIIAKIARTLEPAKPSGGFSPSGLRTFKKVHREFVRDALKNGLYARLVRSGELSMDRVREIVKSAKLEMRDQTPDQNLQTNDPKDWLIHVEYGGCILYDKKLKDAFKNTGNDQDEYWIEKMIKGVVLVREPKEGYGILVQFGGDNDKIKRMMITCAISYCVEEKIKFFIDPEDRKYVDSKFGIVSETPSYEIGHERYLVKPINTINLNDFAMQEKSFRRSFDKYDEFKHRLLELAYGKFQN